MGAPSHPAVVRVIVGTTYRVLKRRLRTAVTRLRVRLEIRDERLGHAVVQVRDRDVHDEFDYRAVVEERPDAREGGVRERRRSRELERRGDGSLLLIREERAVVGVRDRVD